MFARALGCGTILLLAANAPAQTTPSYARDVQPFLARYCLECHNPESLKGELNLEAFAEMMRGGKNGAVVVAGKPDESRLVLLVEGKAKPPMPPRSATRHPKPGEAAVLRNWIAAGARNDTGSTKAALPPIKPTRKAPAPVAALAFAPDGKALYASAYKDVFRIEGDRTAKVTPFSAMQAPVTALAISPDGKRLAVASSASGASGTVTIFSLSGSQMAKPERNLAAHADEILDMAFSPDNKLLATAGYDRLIKIWDVGTGKLLRTLKDHSDSVYSIAFHPSGKLLASGGADRAVKVWEVETGKRLYTLSDSTDWVYTLAWRPDGKQLAAGGVDKSIRVFDASAAGGKLVHSVFAHQAPISKLRFKADGTSLFSLGEDRVVKSWDPARMVETHVYAAQPDQALAFVLSPKADRLALGRFDGALVLLDIKDGKVVAQPLPVKPPAPMLSSLSPDAGPRGKTVTLTVNGQGFDETSEIAFLDPGLMVLKPMRLSSAVMNVSVTVPEHARVGAYKLVVKGQSGQSAPMNFHVDRYALVVEKEPNGSPSTGQLVALPATVSGALQEAGDVDFYRVPLEAGQQLGIEVQPTGKSRFDAVLQVVDAAGKRLAETNSTALGFTAPRKGIYILGLRDHEYRGNKDMAYRLNLGNIPVVTALFPLGVERGKESSIQVEGVHLGTLKSVMVKAAADGAVGSRQSVPFPAQPEPFLGEKNVVVGAYPEVTSSGNQEVEIPVPGTANGRITSPGATPTWRFDARKGERLILEVNARRLGSPLDSYLEILDTAGHPVPRAVLRSVGVTYTTLRDHDATGSGIRLESWNDLATNDYLWSGSELMRIQALPRNPDDDCQFYAVGGQRLGFLDTTPSFHSFGTPLYKVQIHPPGTTFPPNGFPVVRLNYRNDDGGPGYGKDSRILFDPPADGTYQVRVGDSRGLGGVNYGYRLTVRKPEPRFTVQMSPASPAVWKGGAVPVTITATRIDGYEGPITVRLTDLPAGFQAPATTISAGQTSTAVALFADAKAPSPGKTPIKVKAEATIDGRLQTNEQTGGVPKLVEPGDLTTKTNQPDVTLKPGGQAGLTAIIERRNGFAGRVPLSVLGLPHGVRVLDVGLNGILITEKDDRRSIVIYAEPWVQPGTFPFVVMARNEKKGTEHAAQPVMLHITSSGQD